MRLVVRLKVRVRVGEMRVSLTNLSVFVLATVAILAMMVPAAFAQNSTHTIWTSPETGIVYDIPKQGYYCLDFDGDYICDIDFNNGKMIIYGASDTQEDPSATNEQNLEEDAVDERPSRDGNNDNGKDNPRDDPDCWYYDIYVCDESGECDSENVDCYTDCDNGPDVITGEPCRGEKQGDETGDKRKSDELPECDDVEYGTTCDDSESEDSWTDDETEDENDEENDEDGNEEGGDEYEDEDAASVPLG
jgi:hypothetical protein